MSDTLERVADSEESGTTYEERESVSEEQNAEAADATTSEDESEGSQAEEWLVPGKFKRGEEEKLVQAYRNLESEFSRRNNEIANLKRGNQQAERQADPEEEVRNFAKELKDNPLKAIRKYSGTEKLYEEIKASKFESAYQRAMQNSEFAALEPVMAEIAETNRDLIQDPHDPKLLNILYYAAKGMKQDDLAKQAEARGKKKGEVSATKKIKAQVEGASGSRGHVSKNIDDMTSEEIKKAIMRGDLS